MVAFSFVQGDKSTKAKKVLMQKCLGVQVW